MCETLLEMIYSVEDSSRDDIRCNLLGLLDLCH